MVDYWLTRKGIKRGNVPNPATNLYRIYVSFMGKLDLPDTWPVTRTEFEAIFRQWGVEEVRIGKYRCYLLSKYIVPKSVMDPTARRKPPKPKRVRRRRRNSLPKPVETAS